MSDRRLELTLDLADWEVTLTDGSVIHLLAHAYSQEDGYIVFSALMRGAPNYEVHLARIPQQLVTSVFSV